MSVILGRSMSSLAILNTSHLRSNYNLLELKYNKEATPSSHRRNQSPKRFKDTVANVPMCNASRQAKCYIRTWTPGGRSSLHRPRPVLGSTLHHGQAILLCRNPPLSTTEQRC